jgi:hypothetical protein
LAITATGRPINRALKLDVIVAIENTEDDFFDFVRQAMIGGEHAIQIFSRPRGSVSGGRLGRFGQLAELPADHLETLRVILSHVVRDAAGSCVELGAAERFRVDNLAGRALDEIRAAQAHEARLFDHDQNIAERGKIGAAGDARSHHRGNLRHPEPAPHKRIIKENTARAVLSGKNTVLVREVHPRGINQIENRRAVAHGDFLRPQNFGYSFGPPRARLDGGVVGHDDRRTTLDFADAGDHARRRRLPVVLIVGDEQPGLEKSRAGIEQFRYALPSRQLAGLVLFRDLRRTAPRAQPLLEFVELFDEQAHLRGARFRRVGNGFVSRHRPTIVS